MEKAYKVALEIILEMCKRDNYINTANLILVCSTALSQKKEDLGKAISEACQISSGGNKSV